MMDDSQVPDAARLTDEQIEAVRDEIPWNEAACVEAIARAAEGYAWHSRDAEVAELEDDVLRIQALGNERLAQLQEQLDAVEARRVEEYDAWQVLLTMRIKERDAARDQRDALVEALEVFLVYVTEDLADQDGEILGMPGPYETIFAALAAAKETP